MRLSLILGVIILAGLVLVVLLSNKSNKQSFFSSKTDLSNWSNTTNSASLKKIIEDNLSGSAGGEYAIVIEDLTDHERFAQNEDELFPAASLYKLYVMAAVLKEVDQGNLQLTETVANAKTHLSEVYGGVDFGYEDSPENISYSVDEALQRIGRISDNFAALTLAENLGWDKVADMASSIGATHTVFQNPVMTTAGDTAIFFKKLNDYSLPLSKDSTDKLMGYLALNQINDRIPANLPEDTKIIHEQSSGLPLVVHKTGELPGVRNDAGLVFLDTPEGPRTYLIVLMSKDLLYEDDGVELLANISKDVYDYFKEKYQ